MALTKFLSDRADAVATIKKLEFRIASITLFTFALLSVLLRIGLKLHHTRSFHLDDYILFFGTICLIAGTGMLLHYLDYFYLGPAIQNDPKLVSLVPMDALMELNGQLGYIYATLTLLWTATFCVKFSFLAFFWEIVRAVQGKGMRILYWATVGTCVVGWIYVILSPFLVCARFGAESVKCYQNPDSNVYGSLTYLGTVLDVLSDVMIVSIPILVLHRTALPLRQKLAIGTFLSLSIVMIALSVIRSAKIHGPPGVPEDVSWMLFWVYAESSIAVLMVSITAWRTVFNLKRSDGQKRERMRQPPSYLRYLGGNGEKSGGSNAKLPSIPSPTFKGLKSIMRRSGREDDVVFRRSEEGFGWLEKSDDERSLTPVSYRVAEVCVKKTSGEMLV